MSWTNRLGKWLFVGAALTATGAAGTGCLSRPVGTQPPTTKVNFTSTVSQQQVDKVNLLFMIDNSASMGDKQTILADAVPNLLVGLLQPKCVDGNGKPDGANTVADPNGNKSNRYGCPTGFDPEFRPITDMHIGIISSSLGSFGGDVCGDSGRLNDKAHLLNIVKGGSPRPEGGSFNFLSWYPTNEENTHKDRHPDPPTPAVAQLSSLQSAFQDIVKGVDQTGCGLEAQLESFYRFLIQPDPWVKVVRDGADQADLGGPADVDVELLTQRANFLREDSLVAVILLTDEDDSSADPLSAGGQGWAFMANQFPSSTTYRIDGKSTTAPRGTSTCHKNPAETGYQADGKTLNGQTPCTSCGFAVTCNTADPLCQKIKNNPECQTNGGYYGAAEDNLNVRFHRMKERYGINPQYPISRYVDGLTKFKVPDRTTEHTSKVRADGKGRNISDYVGTGKCTNPLFARNLPKGQGDETCNLVQSTRRPDLIFFAVVGGVPNSLLHFDPENAEKSRIINDDWNKILGRDPAAFNYTDIDPHMIQSVSPRAGIPGPAAKGDNGDANNPVGRDWETNSDDLQYACTFDLPTPRTCVESDPSCDCGGTKAPPLCKTTAQGNQVKAKAYPTIREFQVVRKLGEQGIIASLCPITLAGSKQDPSYGYNPAVKTIIDRLKNALTTQCLPQQLTPDADKKVPCLVLAQLGDASQTCEQYQLSPPAKEILDKFQEQQRAEGGGGTGANSLANLKVCELTQLVVGTGETCKDDASIGWCYVENGGGKTPAGRCPQALIFSGSTGALAGARFSLQCINQFNPGQAAGEAAKP